MSSSFLSHRIKRTSDLLKVGAADQVSEYEERFQSFANGDYFLIKLSETYIAPIGS